MGDLMDRPDDNEGRIPPHACEDDFHFELVGRCIRERVCNVCHRRWHTWDDDSSD